MAKRVLKASLAILGTILVWFPVVFMLLTSAARTVRSGRFGMDYLMPAELFPAVLAGGALILVAAALHHRHVALSASGLGVSLASLGATLLYARLSGLAEGAVEATGTPLLIVSLLMGVYVLTLPFMGVVGILLIGDIFRSGRDHSADGTHGDEPQMTDSGVPLSA